MNHFLLECLFFEIDILFTSNFPRNILFFYSIHKKCLDIIIHILFSLLSLFLLFSYRLIMPDVHEAMNRCKVAIDEMQRQIQAKVEAADMVSECKYNFTTYFQALVLASFAQLIPCDSSS